MIFRCLIAVDRANQPLDDVIREWDHPFNSE